MEEFEIKDNVLVKYNGNAEEVIIPDGVKEIGEHAFSSCKALKTIKVPASVKKIGNGAFSDCASLEKVDLEEGLERINSEGFANCEMLKEINIPKSIKEISSSAFSGCTGLKSENGFIFIGTMLVAYIGEESEAVIPDKTTIIGGCAFADNKFLKKITVPASVKKIGGQAFGFCKSLEEIVFSEGLKTIEGYAFYYSKSLKTITIPSSVKSIGNGLFERCEALERICLPNGLSKIGYILFKDCKSLSSITIPASVEKINDSAFAGCESLSSVIFEGSVSYSVKFIHNCPIKVIYAEKASVADFTLFRQEYLNGFAELLAKGVAIDNEIVEKNNEYIKRNAQKLCVSASDELFTYILKNKFLSLKDTDLLIAKYNEGKNVARVSALIDYKDKNFTEKQKERQFNKQFEVKAPTEFDMLRKTWTFSKKEDGTYRIFGYKGEDVDIVIPAIINGVKVTEIGNGKRPPYYKNLFFGDFSKKVRSITLQDGIETIADWTFRFCESLKTVTIPASVKRIGEAVFSYCRLLERVVLPEGLEEISGSAFSCCASLNAITIPALIKRIGNNAFNGCKSLEKIILPQWVETIGNDAFSGCSNITIYCRNDKRREAWHKEWNKLDYDGHKVKVVWGYKGE